MLKIYYIFILHFPNLAREIHSRTTALIIRQSDSLKRVSSPTASLRTLRLYVL